MTNADESATALRSAASYCCTVDDFATPLATPSPTEGAPFCLTTPLATPFDTEGEPLDLTTPFATPLSTEGGEDTIGGFDPLEGGGDAV